MLSSHDRCLNSSRRQADQGHEFLDCCDLQNHCESAMGVKREQPILQDSSSVPLLLTTYCEKPSQGARWSVCFRLQTEMQRTL